MEEEEEKDLCLCPRNVGSLTVTMLLWSMGIVML